MTSLPLTSIILFDDQSWQDLLPLTFTRPLSELRVGILTIKEKWEHWLHGEVSYITQDYLSEKFKLIIQHENYLINSSYLPTEALVLQVKSLSAGQAIYDHNTLVAAKLSAETIAKVVVDKNNISTSTNFKKIDGENLTYERITKPYHIFSKNGQELTKDFNLITTGRQSQAISNTNQVFGKHPIFLEKGVYMECCIINTHEGPVYLGKDVQVMEGSMIRGGFAACEGSIVKMGAKIYGPTTIGPHCRLGGEVNNSVLLANSNKGHDGFLGNSVIGEWCNLGADTNNSNLKNNYLPVKIWSYSKEGFEDTGLQFCGLIMGDHSKAGINTMFNTGTVVGVAANIFGDGFPRNFIPSFSWGGASGIIKHQLNKALETAAIVLKRRNQELSDEDANILTHLFQAENQNRFPNP